MKPSIAVASLCALSLVAGCATAPSSAWTPTIDSRNTNQARYEKDLSECRSYATANPDADAAKASKKGAVKFGVESAALMGAVAIATGGLALIPMMAGTVAVGAGAGAYGGAQGGKTMADAKYHTMVTNCLNGRGYKVLD